MIGAFRSVYRCKVSTCIVEYVGQYCESKSVCCLSVDVVDESRRGTVTSTITLLNTICRQTTESTGTLLHVLPTTLTTTNGSHWKAGLLT